MDTIRSCLSLCWPFTSRATQYERISQWDLDAGTARLSDEQELVIFEDGNQISLTILENGLRVVISERSAGPFSRNSQPHVEVVPYVQVLLASVSFTPGGRSLVDFSYLSAAASKLQLRQVSADVSLIPGTAMLKWVADVQARAYQGVTPRRRFLVVINPHGGQGKAKKLWKETVEPIFAAAGCVVYVQYTGPAGSPTNAATIARNVDLEAYDALVPVSGDGISNELLNGLASRPDALCALRMPIAPIPAGSGNALSVNIMGPVKVLDGAYAAMNAIKGQPIPLDISSVSQGDTRIYSFLSQAFGLLADLDMGTEWIRWVGGIRFVLGYLYGVLTGCRYEVEITMKVVASDKHAMVAEYNTHQQALEPAAEGKVTARDVRMPPLVFGTTDSPFPRGVVHERLEAPVAPGWHTFRTPLQFICAGRLPWLSRESMTLPLVHNDGLVDVMLVPPRSALDSFKSIDGQEEGRFLREQDCYYYKVEAYRCTPLERTGYISIDGESIPYKVFQVENHPRLARVMSMETRLKGPDRITLGP
ncbi:ATP-NAD kinase-like domain-containing protein [Mycena belliarum]|uniref:ATP-NAD kinase-like domain-containing protein n=1 Tax=Mycena belliarum TaxID=1033014 RepID=A0AAD6XQU2_9AGAR|nr:ATP-NAD kinase-like domain-containing protein [Mycena belliae]